MQELQDIVAQCLQKDPAKRPSCSQLLKHKFFKKAEDSGYLVKYLLNGSNGTPFKDMLRTVTRTFRSSGSSPKSEVCTPASRLVLHLLYCFCLA